VNNNAVIRLPPYKKINFAEFFQAPSSDDWHKPSIRIVQDLWGAGVRQSEESFLLWIFQFPSVV